MANVKHTDFVKRPRRRARIVVEPVRDAREESADVDRVIGQVLSDAGMGARRLG